MTSETRKALKAAVDQARREQIASTPTIEPGSIIVTESGIEETLDEETLARLSAIWRSRPWRMSTTCSSCGTCPAHCAGETRETVVCLACFLAGPTGRRKRMTTKTETVSIRPAFHEAVTSALPGVTVAESKTYDRLVEGKRTIAYVGGDRKLRVEVRVAAEKLDASVGDYKPGSSGLMNFYLSSAEDFERVVTALRLARADAAEATPAAPPETVAEPAAPKKRAAKAKGDSEVKPDPKPARKSRSRAKAPAA